MNINKKALKIAVAVVAVTAVAIGVAIGVSRNKNASLRSATVSASQAQAFTTASGRTRASYVDGLTSEQMDTLMEAIDQGAQEFLNTEPGTVQSQFGSGPAPLTGSSMAAFSGSSLNAANANGGGSKASKGYTIIKE
jgi:hypothetical protein